MSKLIGIDPTVDYAFKRMLGSPQHSGVTIHFLNAVLSEEPRITRVDFQNPILDKEFDDDKLSILDILALDERGRHLNIEMQTSLEPGLRQRLAYYDASLYIDQMTEGRAYNELRPAIMICVLSLPLFPGQGPLHLDFRMRDRSGQVLTNDLQIHTLELTKLAITRENLRKATMAEWWAYFLRYSPTMTMDEIRTLFPAPEFIEAAGVLEMIRETEKQMYEYRVRKRLLLDDATRLKFARQEGHEEGRGEGELLGRIITLQEFLSESVPTREELLGYELSQLTALCEKLQQRIRESQ